MWTIVLHRSSIMQPATRYSMNFKSGMRETALTGIHVLLICFASSPGIYNRALVEPGRLWTSKCVLSEKHNR